jgi:hypothetical protein
MRTLTIVCALVWAAFGFGAGAASAQGPVATPEPDSPAWCTSYSTGADTHTTCAPPLAAPLGAAIACHNYSVGSDLHAECAPVAQAGLGGPRAKRALPIPPPASPLRCYTYRIGPSTYTDCR